MMIRIFTKPGCVQCNATKRTFESLGFTENEIEMVDLTQDDAAMAEAEALGYRQVPVVFVGDMHWAGFQPGLISKAVDALSGLAPAA